MLQFLDGAGAKHRHINPDAPMDLRLEPANGDRLLLRAVSPNGVSGGSSDSAVTGFGLTRLNLFRADVELSTDPESLLVATVLVGCTARAPGWIAENLPF